jgi:D-alanine-D-alanine ligase
MSKPADTPMIDFGRVGVLYGGRSAERDVSIMSGTGVLQALQSKGVDAHGFDTGRQSLAELATAGFDRVFIALHGRYGEDGSIQGALEQLGIPYTGSGVMASGIAMDKVMTKRIWASLGLPTPPFVELDALSTTDTDLQKAAAYLALPLMLKAPHEGSTIGIAKVNETSQLRAAFDDCARYDETLLAETFIRGREITVPVLGRGRNARALPVVEIRAPGGNYDYHNKYFSDDTQYFCPAPFTPELTAKVQQLAVRAFNALGCSGWARVDFMIREGDDAPFLLEINTSPGMTGHSLVPMSAKAAGTSYEDLCVQILAMSRLELKPVAPPQAAQATGGQ